MKKIPLICFVFLFLSSCSVIMAATKGSPPDLSVVKRGHAKEDIEKQLKRQTKKTVHADGSSTVTYEITMGTENNGSHVLGHLVMDVITLGFWEPFGTYAEWKRGMVYLVVIDYDQDGVATAIKSGPKN